MATACARGRFDTPGAGRSRCWATVVMGVMLAAAAVPGVASADPPRSFSESGASVFCDGDQQVGLWLGQGEDHRYLELSVWSEGEGAELSGSTDTFDYDGTTLTAEVDLYSWTFGEEEHEGEDGGGDRELVGTATITAQLTPIGEPEVYEDAGRDGNRRYRFSESYQQAEVAGSITLDGVLDVDLSGCEASQYAYSSWSTDPAASVHRYSGTYLECGLDGPGGAGYLYASTDGRDAFADLFLESEEGFLFGFTDQATFTDTALTATIDLYEETFHGEGEAVEHDDGDGPGGEPVATAQVDALLTSQGTETQRIRFPDGRVKETIETFSVTGTVVIDGDSWELVDCVAEGYDVHEQFVDPNGPPTTGPAPSNDVPADAEPIEVGDTIRDRTNTAVPAPEAPCTATYTEDGETWEYEVPLGRTLWYEFTATGTSATVDTAGSDFDTVVGIYDTDLQPIACVDDVGDETGFSLQAAVSIDTVPGETYLVQVGGYGYWPDEPESQPDYGRLLLTVTD